MIFSYRESQHQVKAPPKASIFHCDGVQRKNYKNCVFGRNIMESIVSTQFLKLQGLVPIPSLGETQGCILTRWVVYHRANTRKRRLKFKHTVTESSVNLRRKFLD